MLPLGAAFRTKSVRLCADRQNVETGPLTNP